jgi:hypothetical protein
MEVPQPFERIRKKAPGMPAAQLLLVAGLSGALIFIVASMAFVFREPWLFASLGPSAYLHALYPHRRESSFYNTVVGHFIGIGTGVLAVTSTVLLTGADATLQTVITSVMAVVLTVLLQLALGAYHAPAASTTLLFALGATAPTPHGVGTLAIGVVLLASFGEIIRAVSSKYQR